MGLRLKLSFVLLLAVTVSCGRRADLTAAAMQDVNRQAAGASLAMDYGRAAELYRSVPHIGGNRVEWLVSYIGMMEICQRTSDNTGFYEYRNLALQELRDLESEGGVLTDSLQMRVCRAQAGLRLTSAEYYRELEQNDLANREMSLIDGNNATLDVATLIRIRIMEMSDPDAVLPIEDRVDVCGHCIRQVDAIGDRYVKALAEYCLAGLYLDCGNTLDAVVSALGALADFLHYNAEYESIMCYELIGSCKIAQAEYEEALNYLIKALDRLNDCRDMYWPELEELPFLDAYRFDNEIVELQWLEQCPMSVVPELMSSIREKMSLAYSGLGDKFASDYNRNVCLELQKSVRLDRRYEARKELLERTNRHLGALIAAIVALMLSLVLFYAIFGRRIRHRNDSYVRSSESLLDLCESILALGQNGYENISERLHGLLEERLPELVGVGNACITEADSGLKIECTRPELKTVASTVQVFADAALRNAELAESLDCRQNLLEKENSLALLHTIENRRQNLARKACCSVVQDCTQLVERLDAEAARLESECTPETAGHRLEYIGELADSICRHYDALSRWGRLRQGEVSLHIESFELSQVLGLLKLGKRNFDRSGLEFTVAETDAFLKADRALTLFMLNTLADNARKFTPRGGKVEVGVEDLDDCVRISVSDTGVGMSSEDLARMLESKVYNPDEIGRGTEAAVSKGSGFGIMNCKGIVERYRREGDLFNCCEFGAESKLGRGSRIWFTLPKSIRRILLALILLLSPNLCQTVFAEQPKTSDSLWNSSDSLLDMAYTYAENAYKMNIDGRYSQALGCADTAIMLLNEDWIALGGDSSLLLSSNPGTEPAELLWFENNFPTDYETVLWLRNEMAVSALALADWSKYSYNNDAYLRLFKLYFSESEIENDCLSLQRSNANLTIAIVLLLLMMVALLFFRFIFRSRGRLRYRSDLQQMLEIMLGMQKAVNDTSELGMQVQLDSVLSDSMDKLQHLLPVSAASVSVNSEGTEYSSNVGTRLYTTDNLSVTLPLMKYYADKDHRIGSMTLQFTHKPDKNDLNAFEMLAGYMSTLLSGCVLGKARQQRSVELLEEESSRLQYERDHLHVENMVLDNCLSTLRHETLYYPGRIGLIARKAISDGIDNESFNDIKELSTYYREVFGILGRRAVRQISDLMQHPEVISVAEIYGYVADFLKRKKLQNIELNLLQNNLLCNVDNVLARILAETLAEQVVSNPENGVIQFSASADGDFVMITMTDMRPCCIHSPELMFTPLWSDDNLNNVICSQIIREIDAANNHMGCRINAEVTDSGHLTVKFTLPQAITER